MFKLEFKAQFYIFVVFIFYHLNCSTVVFAQVDRPGVLIEDEEAPARITIYEHEQFTGYRKNLKLRKGQCLNLYEPWNDHASSIDPNESCVLIWQNHNCAGRVVRLQKYRYGTERLAAIRMNDEISSIQLC